MVTGPEILHGLGSVPDRLRGAMVIVGRFDGVDSAHQAAVARLTDGPGERRAIAVVVSGDPTREVTPPAEKARLLGVLGVSAIVFVERASGQGSVVREALAALGPTSLTFADDPETDTGTPDSRARPALAGGDVATAARLLGYRWFARGEVIHGDKRGRELGFPTANIALSPSTPLRHGIYAVRVRRADQILDGVASFGIRPTFGGGAPLLEVFLFDFAGDLYGETLEVAFVAWIRPELRFDGIEPLVARIREDEREARRLLAAAGPGSLLDRQLAATNS